MQPVYLVTHGAKGPGPDPRMTPETMLALANLKPLLPADIGLVIAGEGRRHRDVALALALDIAQISAVLGTAAHKCNYGPEPMIELADGFMIPEIMFATNDDMMPAMVELVWSLIHQERPAVLCTGRMFVSKLLHSGAGVLMTLGPSNPKPNTIYKAYSVHDTRRFHIDELGYTD